MERFVTTSRRLEQYLFMNEITYVDMDKAEDGLTRWWYERTADLDECLSLFQKVQERRRNRYRAEKRSEA